MLREPRNKFVQRYGFLAPYIKKYAKPFLLAISCLTTEVICDLMQPTIVSKIIDQGVAAKDTATVMRYGGLMLLIAGFGALAAIGRNAISSKVSQNFGSDLRADLYRRILALEFSSLDRLDTASLVTRLTNDVTQVQNLFNGLMRIFVRAPLLAIGGIIMATILNARLSLILVVVVPMVAYLISLSLRTSFPFFKRIQESLDRVNGVMREYLSGLRVVKAFNRSVREEERFAAANDNLSGFTTRAMGIMAIFSPLTALAVSLGIAAVLWFGGYGVDGGTIKVGEVVAYVNYMTQILFALMMLSHIFTMFVRARTSAERIGEVLAIPTQNAGAAAPTAEASRARGERAPGWSIDYRSVSLRYEEAASPALRDIGFACPAGSMMGIIGSTGSGKTSLVRLMPRFYRPTEGAVLIGGRDITEWDLRALRDGIALVPQKSILFTGTIEENLRWGKADAELEELDRATEAAAAGEFIAALPKGYGTQIGRGGLTLSGGQRQRLAIARALVRRPSVLILDDSLSAVDGVTENLIRTGLRRACPGATIVIIAQRIASVRDLDTILVLDEGAAVGLGTHEELLASCPVYQDIRRSQVGIEEATHG